MSLYWVNLPHATFGIETRDGLIAQSAPIARWTRGKKLDTVLRYYGKRYPTMEVIAVERMGGERTGLTPEQHAACEATLRAWRSDQPDQVPCHYCGTLVWLQHAEPVPDNPADPYDRYACASCGGDGQGCRSARDRSARRHRARQLRARIVEVAAEYKEACAQHEGPQEGWRDWPELMPAVVVDDWRRTRALMEQRREVLFALLGELEGLEGDGA